jgi:hypothetical protein
MSADGTKRQSERLTASAATNTKSDVQQWLADWMHLPEKLRNLWCDSTIGIQLVDLAGK